MMNIRKKVTQFSYMQLILYYFTCETNFANTKLPSFDTNNSNIERQGEKHLNTDERNGNMK